FVLLCLAWPAQAQSLAAIAKKEEERRKATAEPAKVYTNKDLHKPDAVSNPPDAAKPADVTKDAKDADAKDKAKDGASDKADDKKAIADLLEEARQAGVPPAWLR